MTVKEFSEIARGPIEVKSGYDGKLLCRAYNGKKHNLRRQTMIECMRAMGHDDMVRVVRCRDCKWWSGVPCGTATPEWCECSSILGMRAARADDFCSYGQRKDGAE